MSNNMRRKGLRAGKAATGVSRSSSQFGKKNAAAGAVGERILFSELDSNPFTSGYDIWSSMRLPNYSPNVDVDIVVSSGNKVVLLDSKMWAAAHNYWSIFGMPMQDFAPRRERDGSWKALSKNMANAKDRYTREMPFAQVSAMVLFVPTGKRKTPPKSVRFLKFPGNVRSYQMQDGVRRVHRILGDPKPTDAKVQAVLQSLVKRG